MKNLNDYLVDDIDFKNFDEIKNKENLKIKLPIRNIEIGEKETRIIINIDQEKISNNITENFIGKSEPNKHKNTANRFIDEIKDHNKGNFRLKKIDKNFKKLKMEFIRYLNTGKQYYDKNLNFAKFCLHFLFYQLLV